MTNGLFSFVRLITSPSIRCTPKPTTLAAPSCTDALTVPAEPPPSRDTRAASVPTRARATAASSAQGQSLGDQVLAPHIALDAQAALDGQGVAELALKMGTKTSVNPVYFRTEWADEHPTRVARHLVDATVESVDGPLAIERPFVIYGLPGAFDEATRDDAQPKGLPDDLPRPDLVEGGAILAGQQASALAL